MEVDWDLNAVVRGCNTTTATAAAATTTTTTTTTAVTITSAVKDDFDCKSWFTPLSSEQSGHLFTMVDPFEATNAIEELHELYKPFCSKSHEPVSPKSIISSTKPVSTLFKQQRQTPPKQTHGGSLTTTASSHLTSRSKRRKNQLKRVCQVPAEGLSADVWAWRKYGQKPIKGSPYPRGYYRCSSSKGCLARKQVERNRSDPNMFIVTYTAEHNHPAPTHRNSLAGSTRQKPVTPQTVTASDSTKTSSSPSGKPTLSSSSPATSSEEEVAPQSTKAENREIDMAEEEEEEDDDFGLSDVGISDDFFKGLEGFASEQRLFDDFPASFELPWTANNAPTAASSI